MAESDQQFISDEWVLAVEKLVNDPTIEVPRATTRLPQAMVKAKEEAYIPQIVSLGPYHHRTLKDISAGPFHHRLSHLSQMEMYKLKTAKDAAENKSNLIQDIHGKIMKADMISTLATFYDWKIEDEDSQKFGWMMTMDAFFLYQFLTNPRFDPQRHDEEHQHDDDLPAVSSIRCDIVKLENQIPLSLLFLIEMGKALSTKKFEELLLSRIEYLSSFVGHKSDLNIRQQEDHVLGCVQRYVSSFLKIESSDERTSTCWKSFSTRIDDAVAAVCHIFFDRRGGRGRGDFLRRYNAEELHKAGITFESFTEGSCKIRFDKNSDTLYLPQILVIDTYTEVILRNLLALELNDGSRHKAVTNYVELMDCLIDTPEDVELLRESGVIVRRSMMITDDYVAKMWEGMCKPLFGGLMEPPPSLKAKIDEVLAKNYYKSMIKTMWREFCDEYLARPWQVVALLVGIFLLAMDTMQTYCSFRDCQSSSKPLDKSPSSNGAGSGSGHFTTFG